MNATTVELRWDGEETFVGNYQASITYVPTGSQNYQFRVLKNGAPLTPAQTFGTSGEGAAATQLFISVEIGAVQNDVFRIQVQNTDGDDDLDVTDLAINIQ